MHGWAALMRYRLRTLLVVMVAFGVWLGLQVNTARRQRAAVAAVQRLGGTVYFEHQLKHDSRGRLVAVPEASVRYPEWLRPVAERVFPPGVVSVRLRDMPATDRDLELLKSLPRVSSGGLNGFSREFGERALRGR
jgi:hypothetical protein